MYIGRRRGDTTAMACMSSFARHIGRSITTKVSVRSGVDKVGGIGLNVNAVDKWYAVLLARLAGCIGAMAATILTIGPVHKIRRSDCVLSQRKTLIGHL